MTRSIFAIAVVVAGCGATSPAPSRVANEGPPHERVVRLGTKPMGLTYECKVSSEPSEEVWRLVSKFFEDARRPQDKLEVRRARTEDDLVGASVWDGLHHTGETAAVIDARRDGGRVTFSTRDEERFYCIEMRDHGEIELVLRYSKPP